MGKKILLLTIFAVSFVFAFTFPLTTNVDAQVSFSNGPNVTNVNTVGGQAQQVNLAWLIASPTNVTITGTPTNDRFKDTVFVKEMGSGTSSYPAWNETQVYTQGDKVSHNGSNWLAGWWTQGDTPGGPSPSPWTIITGSAPTPVNINFEQKPLSLDYAFIPVYSNRAAELEVSSSQNSAVFNLEQRTLYTLIVPINGDMAGATIEKSQGGGQLPTSINRNTNPARNRVETARLINRHGHHLLTLSPSNFKDAQIRIVGVNGRTIADEKLNGLNQTTLVLQDLAAGIYVLNARGAQNANFTQKVAHRGGDFRLAAAFGTQFEVGGMLNSRTIEVGGGQRSAQRSAQTRSGNLSLNLTVRAQGFDDIVKNIVVAGGANERKDFSFTGAYDSPSSKFQEFFTRQQFESMFPNRFGFGRAECANAAAGPGCSQGKPATGPGDGTYDFYSYDALLEAIDLIGEVEVDLIYATDNNGLPMWGSYKMTWRNKRTGETKTIITNGFNAVQAWSSRTLDLGTLDYADFCAVGTLSDRKQELAAFLANITQETSGFGSIPTLVGAGAQPHHWTWGLYWREEVGYTATSGAYRTPDPTGQWNAAADASKSYHGRGAKQLTHPYNYGQFSEFLYGDKNILLNNPELLIPARVGNEESGVLGFASAIWFWMTPQPPKPSCHEVFKPGFNTTFRNGQNYSRMAWTISIINGGLECGGSNTQNDSRVGNRIGHYEVYIRILGEEPEPNLRPIGCDGLVIN